jgi:uroporphyrinogen decarboxylase
MTPRKRFLKAIQREETDRIPIDLGGYLSSIHRISYKNLVDYLKLPGLEYKEPWEKIQQIVDNDEALLVRFRIDTRHIRLHAPDNYKRKEPTEASYIDEWGIHRETRGLYYDIINNPLRKASVRDVEDYPWPDPLDPGRYRGLRQEAKNLYQNTEYAIIGDPAGFGFVELGCALRGYDNFLMDMYLKNDIYKTYMKIAVDIMKQMWTCYLGEVGEFVQAVWTCDDFGIQESMLVSPELFREEIKPRYKTLISHIKNIANVKVIHHSCGSIFPIIGDLADIGIDTINPVQPLAKDMSPEKVKKTYGNRMSFHGAIDIQELLSKKSPKEVIEEVKRVAAILARGGGYILAPGHNIQPDVKPQNIVALFDALFYVSSA